MGRAECLLDSPRGRPLGECAIFIQDLVAAMGTFFALNLHAANRPGALK
jgi:hypothetical protein